MIVCILLAAGSSTRMGEAKMLLQYNNKTFLQHGIDEIKNSRADKLVVVTGCYHQQLIKILSAQQIESVYNENWETGMGSSIQAGVAYIFQHYPSAHSIIITVCDQPYISAALFNELIAAKNATGKSIIASAYKSTTGTPVLFDKKYFDQLLQLRGPSGAKQITLQFANDVAAIPFANGAIDVDTPDDYKALT